MKIDLKKFCHVRMGEWRDGQPGCMGCLKELEIGMMVCQDRKTLLIYCEPCSAETPLPNYAKKGGV